MITDMIPKIFWYSDPVGPDETVLISGEDFAADAVAEFADGDKWVEVKPLQRSSQSLKAVVPSAFKMGIFQCRVCQGKQVSKTVLLNAPDVWWIQGDEGLSSARQGGWMRLIGKCLNFNGRTKVRLGDCELQVNDASCYNLTAVVPSDLPAGRYCVFIDDREVGTVEILFYKKEKEHVLNILDYGADSTGMRDSSLAVAWAMMKMSPPGIRVIVYFPRGRYRIDSKYRGDAGMECPMRIHAGVTLRGEGRELTSLWWPDRKEPLPSLIEGGSDFAIEDLSIYTQGRHNTLIHGESNVRIKNLTVRANCHYMTRFNGAEFHGRSFEGQPYAGAAFYLVGSNNQITNCDIYTSGLCFHLLDSGGTLVAGNKVMGNNLCSLVNCNGLIFEDNEFTGNQLTTGGNNSYMTTVSKHIYYARNRVSHIYGGDREAFTLDGHAGAYLGKVTKVDELRYKMDKPRFPMDRKAKGSVPNLYDLTAFVISGRGRGQYRFITDHNDDGFTIERAWDVEPNASSLVSIGGFNGRHLFIENTASDTGTSIQLYPPNFECIAAGNRSIRTGNINSVSELSKKKDVDFVRVEPSWYNQFLDNHVVVGNGWGCGSNEINGWIGGESTLMIWGEQTYNYQFDGKNCVEFMSPSVLKDVLCESTAREISIPLSIFQIIRRHCIDNNSSIRILGAVADSLVENCSFANCRKGIFIDAEVKSGQKNDASQQSNKECRIEDTVHAFLVPKDIVVRRNRFENTETEFGGKAFETATKVGNSDEPS